MNVSDAVEEDREKNEYKIQRQHLDIKNRLSKKYPTPSKLPVRPDKISKSEAFKVVKVCTLMLDYFDVSNPQSPPAAEVLEGAVNEFEKTVPVVLNETWEAIKHLPSQIGDAMRKKQSASY